MSTNSTISGFSALLIVATFFIVYIFNKAEAPRISAADKDARNEQTVVRAAITLNEIQAMQVMKNVVPGYIRLREQYYVAPAHNISLCSIEQVTPDQLKKAFCYLFDKENTINATATLLHNIELKRYPCLTKSTVTSKEQLQSAISPTSKMLILLKDPMERFIQSYIDICVLWNHACLGCKQNIQCFLEKLSGIFLERNEFLDQYIYHSFAPQTWYCGSNYASNRTVFLQYGNERSTRNRLLSSVSELLANGTEGTKSRPILNRLKGELCPNSRSNKDRRSYEVVRTFITTVPHIEDKIRQIYYSDFDLYKRIF